MKYFFPIKENMPACHKLCKGTFNEDDYGNDAKYEDAMCFDDYMMEDTLMYKAFREVLQDYDYYGITEVRPKEWALICKYVDANLGNEAKIAIAEIENWTKKVFEKHELFTIVGI